jgi:multiple sugar transport system permease protein
MAAETPMRTSSGTRQRRAGRLGERWGMVLVWLLLALAILYTLFPIVWLIVTSLKTPRDIFALPPKIVFTPTLENYRYNFEQNRFGLYFFNSVVISLSAMVISLVVGSLAAYGFLRFRFRGGATLFFLVLATRMAPHVALIVPLFIMLNALGITDTRIGLILVYAALNVPLVMWIMSGFLEELPWELEDAARIDGCSYLGALWRVILPMARAGLAAVAVFTFIANWNEFLMALVLTSTDEPRTMPVALALFNSEFGVRWDYLSAAGVTLMLPTLAFTFLMQKYIVRGLTFGAVKS